MITLLEYLTNYVSAIFKETGYEDIDAKVTTSNRTDLCQFQCNDAFGAAKIYKENPMAIAEKISIVLVENNIFEKVEVIKPGFINITLTDNFLLDYLVKMYNDEKTGMPVISYPDTIILDYGGPNIAKPLHIGHLRSAIIGESLKRIFRYAGYNVIGDIHLGDWGLPMGLIMAEFKIRNPEWPCFSDNFNTETDLIPDIDVNELNEIYPYASNKSKTDEKFFKLAKDITYALQNGHKGYYALWRKIRSASINDLTKVYRELLVDFDLWNGESDSDSYVTELIDILKQKKLLYVSDGAMVVDVANEFDIKPIPPVLIKKSDSSILYATTDLATIIQRVKNYHPSKIWYVVDSRQALHFEQVFRCARKAELADFDVDFDFLGFGTMNGSDGKPFKTRDGGVMRLETLLELAREAAYKQLSSSKYLTTINEEDKQECANRIKIASIKFGDLINHRMKNYIFDIDKFTSFEGKTGPYILYSIARINSIFNKLNVCLEEVNNIEAIHELEERNLVLSLLQSGEAFSQALKDKAPNIICEQVYTIASAYSKFYQTCNIINESNPVRQKDLLNLTTITRRFLLLFLDLLGIEPVEQM